MNDLTKYKGKNGKPARVYSNRGIRTFTTEEFINAAKFVLKEKAEGLNFDKTVYVNNLTYVTITCEKHGDFQTLPSHFLNKKAGCKACFHEEEYGTNIRLRSNKPPRKSKYTKEVYKQHLAKLQPEMKVLYYQSAFDPLVIECKKCGQAWIRNNPQSVLKQAKAKDQNQCTCNENLQGAAQSESRIKREGSAKYPHYDFSKMKYKQYDGKFTVHCKLCKLDFETRASSILQHNTKNICKSCYRLSRTRKNLSKQQQKQREKILKLNAEFIKKYPPKYNK